MKCAICGKDCGRMSFFGTCGEGNCMNEQAKRITNTKEYWLNPFTNKVEETELSVWLRKRRENDDKSKRS